MMIKLKCYVPEKELQCQRSEIIFKFLVQCPSILNNYAPVFNPLNAELNPIRHLLALVRDRHIVHVNRIRVKGKIIIKY